MKRRFADCEIDTERHEFWRDNNLVKLEPQVFDLIALLAGNPGRLVSRDELIGAIWDGRAVSDSTIDARIAAARRAVGDDGAHQAVIETVPRRGIRLVPEVRIASGDSLEVSANSSDAIKSQHVDIAGGETVQNSPTLPDKPSIAVLPFTNMSADPDQEYLADGLAEDIITALSKVSELFVIARNSTFAYKGMSPDVRRVARELGVRTVLEGSVRSAGTRVRITAQLIDAESGSHLWAERYDRDLVDIFELQDEITQEIVTVLHVRLTEGEQARLRRHQTNSIEAWDLYVRAQRRLRLFTREDNNLARELIERALHLDPNFAAAWGILAWTHLADARVGWGGSNVDSLRNGIEAAEKGLAADKEQSESHAILGGLWVLQRQYEEALEAGLRAIDLSPNTADYYIWYAVTLNFVGRAQEAVGFIQKAMRLCPFYPDFYLGILAQSYRLLGRYDEAIATDMERLARNPDNAFSDLRLAACYTELGRDEEARHHVLEALKKNPSYSLTQVRDTDPYRDEAAMEHYVDLLRRAGLPE